jgi:hypothetical protein
MKSYQRNWNFQTKYGISPEEYEEMLKRQDGKCAICHRPPKKNALAVDHDHHTGRVRGLLCQPCNRYLGRIDNDRGILDRIREYLTDGSP